MWSFLLDFRNASFPKTDENIVDLTLLAFVKLNKALQFDFSSSNEGKRGFGDTAVNYRQVTS